MNSHEALVSTYFRVFHRQSSVFICPDTQFHAIIHVFESVPFISSDYNLRDEKKGSRNLSADLSYTHLDCPQHPPTRSHILLSHSSSPPPPSSSSSSSPSSSDTSKPASLIRALSRLRFVLISSSNTSKSSCSFSTSFFFPSASFSAASRSAIRPWRSLSCPSTRITDMSVAGGVKTRRGSRDVPV